MITACVPYPQARKGTEGYIPPKEFVHPDSESLLGLAEKSFLAERER